METDVSFCGCAHPRNSQFPIAPRVAEELKLTAKFVVSFRVRRGTEARSQSTRSCREGLWEGCSLFWSGMRDQVVALFYMVYHRVRF